MITFHLDGRSGVPPYLQIVQQVRHALRVGLVGPGDQLPTLKEAVGSLAVNPNTVAKAYRELELEGLVEGRPGQGTFVRQALPGPSRAELERLRQELAAWLRRAVDLGLERESIFSLVSATLFDSAEEVVA